MSKLDTMVQKLDLVLFLVKFLKNSQEFSDLIVRKYWSNTTDSMQFFCLSKKESINHTAEKIMSKFQIDLSLSSCLNLRSELLE